MQQSNQSEEKKGQDRIHEEARKRVEELKSFYSHLTVFLFVNILLFIINIVTSPDSLWFYWVIIGWGIGLASHALSVFGIAGKFGKKWEEKKIQEYIEKQKNQDT